jgi:two-component system NarL family response regulator
MDLRLPEMNGVQAKSAIRAEAAEAGIIVVTTYSGDEANYCGLHAGARA